VRIRTKKKGKAEFGYDGESKENKRSPFNSNAQLQPCETGRRVERRRQEYDYNKDGVMPIEGRRQELMVHTGQEPRRGARAISLLVH
jgi:hypothetical protein